MAFILLVVARVNKQIKTCKCCFNDFRRSASQEVILRYHVLFFQMRNSDLVEMMDTLVLLVV